MEKIKILIVDDHTIFRDGVRALLKQCHDFKVIGEASDRAVAIEKVNKFNPDLVIMDIVMSGMDGLEATRCIKEIKPAIKILILTEREDKECVFSAIKAGASGFMPKLASSSDLISAIRTLHQENYYLYPKAAIALMEDFREHLGKRSLGHLSEREKTVLFLVIDGNTSKSIAEKLNISVRTVQTHRANLMHKLDIHSNSELMAYG